MRLIAAVILALLSTATLGQRSTDSTGDYAMDLGQVYGAIQAVKFMRDICAEAFPDHIQANAAAYEKWRVRYKPFLQEMERHFSASMWREAKGDPQQHMLLLRRTDDMFMQYREGLKQQMTSDGPAKFRGQCRIYPTYLTTDRTNLEYYYTEQVATIRAGDQKRPAK